MNIMLSLATRLEGLADTALAELYEADHAGRKVARGKVETLKAVADTLHSLASDGDRTYTGISRAHIAGVLDSADRIIR